MAITYTQVGHSDQEAVDHGSVDQLVKNTSVETRLYRQLLLNTFFLALLAGPFVLWTYVATLSRDNLTWRSRWGWGLGTRLGLDRPAWYGRALVGTGNFR